MRLLLFCVGEKEIGFAGDEFIDWNFFNAQEYIAITYIIFNLSTCRDVFPVGKAAMRGRLHDDLQVGSILLDPFALCRG